jgi:hypothetical protein
MSYSYNDPYLAPLVTPEREAIAEDDIAALGTFPADWAARLVVLRVYCLICLESSNSSEDAFAVKLANYRKELSQVLIGAKAAAANASGSAAVFASIPLERA